MINKKRILVLGSTGMLGSAVGSWFLSRSNEYETHLTYRNEAVSYGENKTHFDCASEGLDGLPEADYIINCIGVIKPFMVENPIKAIEINSVFPWKLAEYCKQRNTKLIHITTDCVFSGAKGQYTEEDSHDSLDDYGKSKSLGEPTNCMVLRTSIIGEEIHKKASLIEWVKSQKGQSTNGFVNHHWNGITTRQYAQVCDQIILKELYKENKFHISSPSPITKHKLVSLLGERFDLNLTVNEHTTDISVDRTLMTVKSLCSHLDILEIEQQIKEI